MPSILTIPVKLQVAQISCYLSANDKQKLQEQLQAHYEGSIKETPESKELNRLRKYYSDIVS